MDRINLLNLNILQSIKVIIPGGPPSIAGLCGLVRDSDFHWWNGIGWQVASYGFDVTTIGAYTAFFGLGLYGFPWTPDAVGQYTFLLGLSSPIVIEAVDIFVEQVHFYEAEEPN